MKEIFHQNRGRCGSEYIYTQVCSQNSTRKLPKLLRKIKKINVDKRIFHVSVAFDISSPQILKNLIDFWFVVVFTIFRMPFTSNEIFVVRQHLRHEPYSPE